MIGKTYDEILREEIAELKAEILRLKRGDFTEEEFRNLCHNFSEDDEEKFKAGYKAYQEKLFGVK